MKIITRGRLPETRIWRGTCSHCGTVAEAKEDELEVRSDQREGTWGFANCPFCGRAMTFYEKQRT